MAMIEFIHKILGLYTELYCMIPMAMIEFIHKILGLYTELYCMIRHKFLP